MVMARKAKAKAIKERWVEIADKLIQDIDAEVILAGLLGGTAAATGITPPLTRMLMIFNENLNKDHYALLTAVIPGGHLLESGWRSLQGVLGLGGESEKPEDPNYIALFASGALEAMLMMSLMKNPAFIGAVGNVASAGLKAAGQAIGGLTGGAAKVASGVIL